MFRQPDLALDRNRDCHGPSGSLCIPVYWTSLSEHQNLSVQGCAGTAGLRRFQVLPEPATGKERTLSHPLPSATTGRAHATGPGAFPAKDRESSGTDEELGCFCDGRAFCHAQNSFTQTQQLCCFDSEHLRMPTDNSAQTWQTVKYVK